MGNPYKNEIPQPYSRTVEGFSYYYIADHRNYIFYAELVIRHSENKKLYLYDIINIKKKRAPRLSNKAVR